MPRGLARISPLKTVLLLLFLAGVAAVAVMVWKQAARMIRPKLVPVAARIRGLSDRVKQLLAASSYVRCSERLEIAAAVAEGLLPAKSFKWRLFATSADRSVVRALEDFLGTSQKLVEAANEKFVAAELRRFAEFFDRIESKPLTDAQRRACVICEDNNLVLAGAGTGKTSTMIGRAGYLISSGLAKAEEILMIAYAKKAAQEMQERQDDRLRSHVAGSNSPTIKTFHALGLEIIRKAESRAPSVTPLAEDRHLFAKFVDEQIGRHCELPAYRAKFVRYFGTERYPYRNPFDFESMEEYLEYVRTNELRTLKGEAVKSFEECVIANFLGAHGVSYEYERPYEVNTAGPDFRQYIPDFYLPDYGIYIEHFALNREGEPPPHFERQKYLAGVQWKRETHAKHGTKLVQTYSHMKREGSLEMGLAASLASAGVKLNKKSDEQLLRELCESNVVAEFAESLAGFISNFKDSGMDLPALREAAATHRDSARLTLLLELFEPVLVAYEGELHRSGHIDFSDMIRKATAHVESGAFKSPYVHILIDEFQDISRARANLVLALKRQRQDAALFAVGDDWQSIYRFAGSDIGFTRDFADIFGPTATTALDTTFRFNQQIERVSSNFVLQNPSQIRKEITSISTVAQPAVSMVRVLDASDGLDLALEAISSAPGFGHAKRASVLVLGRYNFTLDQWNGTAAKREIKGRHPMLDINFMTVHSAKGKEADFVVVLRLVKGKHGFPSEKPTDSLLEFILPPKEDFPHAEERRLFYVALTRAKHRVYLVYDPFEASRFVQEIISDARYPICRDEFNSELIEAEPVPVPCPVCGTGFLRPRESPTGSFFACNHFPYCRHTEKPCPKCGSVMRRDDSTRVCTNGSCRAIVPICTRCGGSMVERVGKFGRFWGCGNYRPNTEFSCTNTMNIGRSS